MMGTSSKGPLGGKACLNRLIVASFMSVAAGSRHLLVAQSTSVWTSFGRVRIMRRLERQRIKDPSEPGDPHVFHPILGSLPLPWDLASQTSELRTQVEPKDILNIGLGTPICHMIPNTLVIQLITQPVQRNIQTRRSGRVLL